MMLLEEKEEEELEEIIQKGAKIEENQFEGIVSRCMN
jgi:hypothetical protein